MGEEGVVEDRDSLAHKMQSNLWHSQEEMECSDDGGCPWFRSGRGRRYLNPIGSMERDNCEIRMKQCVSSYKPHKQGW